MLVNQIIEQVLQNMIDTENADFRLSKQQNILELIERDELLVMELLWPQRRVNMVEFIKIMILVVHHKQCEFLYLVMGLIELCKDIVVQQNELSLTDVTSYVCQVEPITNSVVQQMLIPISKILNQTKRESVIQMWYLWVFTQNAPEIIGQANGEICHIINGSLINDAIRHHRLQEVQNMIKNDVGDPKLDEVLKGRQLLTQISQILNSDSRISIKNSLVITNILKNNTKLKIMINLLFSNDNTNLIKINNPKLISKIKARRLQSLTQQVKTNQMNSQRNINILK